MSYVVWITRVACDGTVIPAYPLGHGFITEAAATAAAFQELLEQFKDGTDVGFQVFDADRNPVRVTGPVKRRA